MLFFARYLLWNTYRRWVADRCHGLGAALSFYAILGLPVFVLMILIVASAIFGQDAVSTHLIPLLNRRFAPEMMDLMRFMMGEFKGFSFRDLEPDIVAFVALCLGLGGFSIQLKDSIETIWGKRRSEVSISRFIREQVVSIGFGSAFAFLAVAGMAVRVFLYNRSRGSILSLPPVLRQAADIGLVGVLLSIVCMILYKWIPPVRLKWGDVIPGALITGFGLSIGRVASQWYLSRQGADALSGRVGTLLLLIFWCYYFSQIFLASCELTRVLYDFKHRKKAAPASELEAA